MGNLIVIQKDMNDIINKILNFIKRSNKNFIIIATVISFIIKFLSDLIFYTFGDLYSDIAITLRIVISIIFLIFSSVFFIKLYLDYENDQYKLTPEDYLQDLIKLILLSIGIISLNSILPEEIRNYGDIPNITSFFVTEFTSVFAIVTGLYIFYFLYKWLWFRRHKNTKSYLLILFWILVILLIFEIPFHYYHVSPEELAGITFVVIFSIILVFSILIIIFLTAKKNYWIAVLSIKKKLKLLFFLIFLLVLAIIAFSISMKEQGEGKFSIAVLYTFGSDTIYFMAYFCLIPYLIRLVFSTILALPTTFIVERTTNELYSLTYLNRIVAQTIDQNVLFQTLTELAIKTCRGIASWTEIYSLGKSEIVSTQFLNQEHIRALDKSNELHKFLKTLDKPILIPSIKEDFRVKDLNWSILPIVNSLIAVPLFSGKERVGTLIVLHPEEFGLEEDDLKVMQAFSDNINVALENITLVKDSIEKEKYKKELELARKMEEQLLPKKLPYLPNFSLSAFSLPAKEVGGDFYDTVKLINDKYCLLIGDVSGKGMSAAFYMAQLKGIVLSVSSSSNSARELLSKINKSLYGNIEKSMYITMSAIVIDNLEGQITYARAGHMPLIIKRQNKIESYKPKGIGLGLTSSNIFEKNLEEVQIKLDSGDICVLFTDGINELRDSNNNEFGINSLENILIKYNIITADELLEKIKKELFDFLGEQEIYDDMSMMILCYCNSENRSINNEK